MGGNFEIITPPDPLPETRLLKTSKGGLSAITVSVNYCDHLARILENRKHFDEWIIVTSHGDLETQRLCAEEGLKCLVTDVFHESGDSFNKAKGLNLAIDEANPANWIVSLDSDIFLPTDFRDRLDRENLDSDFLYGLQGRCLCRDPETFETLKVTEPWDALAFEEHPWILGYFQLFHPDNPFSRRFDTKVSSNASAYDDQFAKEFGPMNWRFLAITAVHLGEINTNWNGRKKGDEEGELVDWGEERGRADFAAVLRDLVDLGENFTGDDHDRDGSCHGQRVLHLKEGASLLDQEIQAGAAGGGFDLIILSSAVKAEDFHPLFGNILARLKVGGAIVAPLFDASKWPEWTATLALHLGVPERIREDGWCLFRPEPGGHWIAHPESGSDGEGVILVPISPGFEGKATLALHSLRKFWKGKVVIAAPRSLAGPWDRLAATYRAQLIRSDLPAPGEWDDQWRREVERFSLITVKGLVSLRRQKVIVWHPESICLRSPDWVFAELKVGETLSLCFSRELATRGPTAKPSQRAMVWSEDILHCCEQELIEKLKKSSSLLNAQEIAETPSLFEILSKDAGRCLRSDYFRSVVEFGINEPEAENLVGLFFPLGSEVMGKLICEQWAELEDEAAKSSSCEIPTAPGTTVAVKVEASSLASSLSDLVAGQDLKIFPGRVFPGRVFA